MAAFFSDRDITRHHSINSNPALRFRYIEALACPAQGTGVATESKIPNLSISEPEPFL